MTGWCPLGIGTFLVCVLLFCSIDADVSIPWSVIASVFIYTAIYGVGATLLGLLLFEERDLA